MQNGCFMTLKNGYKMTTTFITDFNTADAFGVNAIQTRFDTAFEESKDDYVKLSELVAVLNLKTWEWYQKDNKLAAIYDELHQKTEEFARTVLVGEALRFFEKVTD